MIPLRSIFVLGFFLLMGRSAHAIRPFITDDARVVGRATPQLETWVFGDRAGLQH